MKIAICDDDLLEIQKIKSIVQDFISLNQTVMTVHTFTSGSDLLMNIGKTGGYDLLILDIIMDGLNGIELATKIRERNDSCHIIFITSSPEFAVDSYKVKAFYYLLKGDITKQLQQLLQKAFQEMQTSSAASIMVKEKGKWTRVPLHTIRYVESNNHSVCFHLNKKETISSFNALNAFEDVLLADKHFVKCQKSFIVNMSFVTSITSMDFILTCGSVVPISRNLYQQIKNSYFDYFFSK